MQRTNGSKHGAKAVAAQGRHWTELSSHAAKETEGWDRERREEGRRGRVTIGKI